MPPYYSICKATIYYNFIHETDIYLHFKGVLYKCKSVLFIHSNSPFNYNINTKARLVVMVMKKLILLIPIYSLSGCGIILFYRHKVCHDALFHDSFRQICIFGAILLSTNYNCILKKVASMISLQKATYHNSACIIKPYPGWYTSYIASQHFYLCFSWNS
jgi:hypothetical protein